MATTKEKVMCMGCGKLKNLQTDFYVSSSPFHKINGRMHVCKQCIVDNVKATDLSSWKETLRMIDRPFIYELYLSSIAESEKNSRSVFGTYMKNLVMPQNRGLTWANSDFPIENDISNVNVEEDENPEIKKDLLKKWGNGFSNADLEFLENFYFEYSHSYATDTPVQINLYKSIAKIHLQAEKELAASNIKGFKDLMELSSKLHNDGNIKPIQSTGANDDKGLSTYGLWIKTVEQDEPCEFFENKPLYEDYDKLQKYIEKWFVRPFKNIFNISKDFDVKDDE